MKYQILLYSSIVTIAIYSCNNPETAKESSNSADSIIESIEPDVFDPIPSKAIELKSEWDSIKLHKIGKESDTITFNPGAYKNLNAEVNGVPAGNIRFNQIIMPDKSSDGPFGKDLNYLLDQSGEYKLIIGESLMQGDPFEGDYILKFKGY
ncbi:hypothetical protein [Sphingobacterium endophyticum]|uniref:hypothetical protein n=1 Tax=Sphingobacterium endophyticum TaxID=2546448 RepID=UPI0012E1F20A|nr:hypothetical protein [Sphingobacterium endophyticum]